MSDARGTPDEAGSAPGDARALLLVAEYTWVTGLIRYYREVELKALVGTGLVLSGVGAAFAALRASENEQAPEAMGMVFAIAASITAFVLPVVLMANMRGMRAVVYAREWLHPLAAELADPRFLAWEAVAGSLYESMTGKHVRTLRWVVSAAVVIFLIGAASLGLVVAAWTVEWSAWSRVIASAAAVCDLAFMYLAFRFARLSELRSTVPDSLVRELEAKAARHARAH